MEAIRWEKGTLYLLDQTQLPIREVWLSYTDYRPVFNAIQTMVDADSEIAPVTPIGQALSTLMLLLGGCMFGVPVAIIATGFEDMIVEQAGDSADSEIYETLKMYDGMTDEDKKRFKKIIEVEAKEPDETLKTEE